MSAYARKNTLKYIKDNIENLPDEDMTKLYNEFVILWLNCAMSSHK